jgi:hypothetical protein
MQNQIKLKLFGELYGGDHYARGSRSALKGLGPQTEIDAALFKMAHSQFIGLIESVAGNERVNRRSSLE